MRSELMVFGLIAIGEIPPAERMKLDPSDFFGHESDVESLKADPKSAVMSIINREWPDVKWTGETSLRIAAIERFKEICRRNKGEAMLYLGERKAEAARKILDNHRANGGVSRGVVEQAETVLAEHGKLMSETQFTTSINE